MCGIAGILDLKGAPSVKEGELHAMLPLLAHRGPDGTGVYLKGHVGLGHTRLSIIDLAGGHQPLHNEDKTIWVVFNGEIFNFIELRKTLEGFGHVFSTKSDTEVIVHAYEQYGDDFIKELNGQFSIALWDEKNDRLLLIRDRVGILPLFYTLQNQRLIFASEIKAMLPLFDRAPALNPEALDQLMTFWAPVSPNTMFEGVFEVSPGQVITVQGGKLTQRTYWDWQFPTDGRFPEDVGESSERLHDLLVDATQLRLRSDVPVGAYLSGGLDSSVLVALIARYGNVPLRTFSINFDDAQLDEGSYQDSLIKHLGADHSRIRCANNNIAEQFIDTIWHTEAPVLRTAPVPMKMLSGLVRAQGYKVVLTGEGSDEVLGGYDIFKEAKIRQFWARNPKSTLRPLLLQRLYPYLNITQLRSPQYLEAFFGAGVDNPDVPFFSHIPRWTTTAKTKEFFSGDLRARLSSNPMDAMAQALPAKFKYWHSFNRAQYIEAKSLMSAYLLCSQGDRMLMANSVEGRFPFLDHRVIEFANGLHPNAKMRVLNEKHVLKRAMGKYLPEGIVKRFKQPYRAPDIPAFFYPGSPDYVADMLSATRVKDYGYFDPAKVDRLVQKIKAGRAIGYKDNMALVGILSTQVWHCLFVQNGGRRPN